MAKKKKMSAETLKNIFLFTSIGFMTLSMCSLILACLSLWFLIFAALFGALFVLFYKFARTIYKGYQIKYMCLGKKFKAEFQEALKKFNTTDEEFIESFKKSAKINYKRNGSVFEQEYSSSWVYRSDEHIPMIKDVFKKLDECVKSKGGFVEFIDYFNQKGDSGYQIYSYLSLDILSNELYYLVADVFHYCDFCLIDIGLSDKFEEKNNEMKKRLTDVYSKILFEFVDEIDTLAKKVDALKQIEKLKD